MLAARGVPRGAAARDDREAIQEALGGPRLPLHRLREDHRRGRRRGAGRRVRPHRHRGERRHDEPRRCGMKAVGARLPRYDGIEHVTGRTTYVDDVRVPGTLWVKALRSPLHSAAISGLDTSKAEAMPGVQAVITWRTCRCSSTGTCPRSGSRPTSRCSRRTRCATRASRSPSSRPTTRRRRWRPSTRSTLDVRGADAALRHPAGVRRRRAEDPPVGQLVPALRGRDGPPADPQGVDRRRVRQGRRDRPGRLPPRGDRARAARDAGRASSSPRRTAGSRSTRARRRSTSRWASSRRTCRCRSTG